jgi:hypothetical protein
VSHNRKILKKADVLIAVYLKDTNIRVSGEDLRRINMSSIAVPGEEDSYWVALSAMHELHCVVSQNFLILSLAEQPLETSPAIQLSRLLFSESDGGREATELPT